MKHVFFIMSFLLLGSIGYGQVDLDNPPPPDTASIVDNTFFDIFYGKPGRAAFYGLIAPAGGQIYNKKWWKVPIFLGVEGFLVYRIWDSNRNYQAFQEVYKHNLIYPDDPMDVDGITQTSILKTYRDKYRKQREYAYVFFIGGHVLSLFEAFIDRHLMEFDISDDLTLGVSSSAIGPIGGVSYRIPLNKKKEIKYRDVIE